MGKDGQGTQASVVRQLGQVNGCGCWSGVGHILIISDDQDEVGTSARQN